MITRRAAFQALAGLALGGPKLLGATPEFTVRRPYRWQHLHLTEWQKDLFSKTWLAILWGLRSDGTWIHVTIPELDEILIGPHLTEILALDIKNALTTLDTFLWDECKCKQGAECRMHQEMFGRADPAGVYDRAADRNWN